jgi:hypothetical protein
MRILIVGGYGTFGGRLVELLESDARLTLLVAGRSATAAQAYCACRTGAQAQLLPTVFDRALADRPQLAALQADLLVDASGPFQAYGPQGYGLVELCIASGVNYLDLADGSDFVAGVARFNDAARAAGVFVLSGVSSFPVLSAAVVRQLAKGMSGVRGIRGGIAPSPYAGVGLNVIRAIASYAGQRIALRRGGATAPGWPFAESEKFVVAVPGRVPLRRLRFSLVDVPDLRVLPDLWPQATDVWMGAAPVPASLHRALTLMAWLVRLRLLRNLSWLPRIMHWVTNHFRWGEHRGGMFVVVSGEGPDGPLVREWHLLAEGNDGPLIPSMGAQAVIGKVLDGNSPPPGARTAMPDIHLGDYEKLFAQRTIYTGTRQRLPLARQPLFHRILGDAWDQLPAAVRRLHGVTSRSTFTGTCTVRRGHQPLAMLAAALIGFPRSGAGQDISVDLSVEADAEHWVRTIGGRRFSSVLRQGRGRSEWLMRESFGPITVDIALLLDKGCLRYIVRGWTLFGIRLPRWLAPRSTALESGAEGKFSFDVTIGHPLTGVIVQYRGLLTEATTAQPTDL